MAWLRQNPEIDLARALRGESISVRGFPGSQVKLTAVAQPDAGFVRSHLESTRYGQGFSPAVDRAVLPLWAGKAAEPADKPAHACKSGLESVFLGEAARYLRDACESLEDALALINAPNFDESVRFYTKDGPGRDFLALRPIDSRIHVAQVPTRHKPAFFTLATVDDVPTWRLLRIENADMEFRLTAWISALGGIWGLTAESYRPALPESDFLLEETTAYADKDFHIMGQPTVTLSGSKRQLGSVCAAQDRDEATRLCAMMIEAAVDLDAPGLSSYISLDSEVCSQWLLDGAVTGSFAGPGGISPPNALLQVGASLAIARHGNSMAQIMSRSVPRLSLSLAMPDAWEFSTIHA